MKPRENCCCFTGHRIIKNEHIDFLPDKLDMTIRELFNQGVCDFIAGGALGFDTIAAEAVLRMRERIPALRLILALPCKEQTNGWKSADKLRYEYILSQADKIIYVSQNYTPQCMHKRNRFMIDNSSHCIFYMTHPSGGTAYTVKYALENHLKMHNIITKSRQRSGVIF